MYEYLFSDGFLVLFFFQSVFQRDGVKGDVKIFKNFFEIFFLDSIGQGEFLVYGSVNRVEGTDFVGQFQDIGFLVYVMQDGKGYFYVLIFVSREQVVGGDVKGYRWMFEIQFLD